MKRNLICLSIMLLLLALSSCKGDKSVFTPTSSGRPYEILVVVNDAVWERPAGRALFNVLDTDVPGLPQPERSFRISYTAPRNYDQVLKMFRNVIIVDIQDIYTTPKFKYATNVHAVPQMIMTIQAPDEATFEEFVSANGETVIDLFVRAEMSRQIAILREKHDDFTSRKAAEMFSSDAWIPKELASYKVGDNFLWASTNTGTSDMSFAMYSYPYTDKNTFTPEYFIHKRDSVMKINIPGAQPGMYMATDAMTVEVKNLSVRGEYAMEARGLWHVKGDMMGGPFVSHARIDRVNSRVVVVEGFVYAPEKLKRNLMRMMEASLYTLKFPYEDNEQDILVDTPVE